MNEVGFHDMLCDFEHEVAIVLMSAMQKGCHADDSLTMHFGCNVCDGICLVIAILINLPIPAAVNLLLFDMALYFGDSYGGLAFGLGSLLKMVPKGGEEEEKIEDSGYIMEP